METEYEAKFLDVDKNQVRTRLKAAGATLERPEFAQRRWVFDLPKEKHHSQVLARVRDEGGIITVTWKEFSGEQVDNPKEIELIVDNFDNAVELLTELGCNPRSFQENHRELWHLGSAKITIDSWPFYEPFVEVEGASEEIVHEASLKAEFDWSRALFCSVSKLYKMKYGEDVHIREMPLLTFGMPNPFA
ncbi:MAG: CYTH domain-containing protein [Minisyncoccia bacterium]